MRELTFEEVRKIVRNFTAVIPEMTDLGLAEVGLAIGKEKHRRAMKGERKSNQNLARIYAD